MLGESAGNPFIFNKKEKNALIAERSLNALQDVLQIIK